MSETPEIEFPARFPVKVMGRHQEAFRTAVLAIVARHVEDMAAVEVRERASRDGNFLSITFTIEAQSRAQLDALYTELTDHEQVLMAL